MPSTDLQESIAQYAELDIEIGRLIAERLYHVCAQCPKPCCRPDVCQQAVESWWLRQVSEHVHGKWWPRDWPARDDCIAMTDSGCMLKAGRPAICRSFVCDKYTEAYGSLWEAVALSFLADLAWEVGHLSGRASLETLDEEDAPKHADRIARRIAAGRRQLELAKRLLDDEVSELAKHRIALRLLCEVPRVLRATTRRAILARLES
jgi:hypothetical protein